LQLRRTRKHFIDFQNGVLGNQLLASSFDNFPMQKHSQPIAFTEPKVVMMYLRPELRVFNFCAERRPVLDKSSCGAFSEGDLQHNQDSLLLSFRFVFSFKLEARGFKVLRLGFFDDDLFSSRMFDDDAVDFRST